MGIQNEKGQMQTDAVPDDALTALNSALGCMADSAKGPHFCANPAEYIWKYLGKKETLIPYNCDFGTVQSHHDINDSDYPNANHLRWERHNVLIIQGDLQPGESNLLSRRLLYIDAESWAILLGEGFDASGCTVKCYMLSISVASGISRHGRWYRIGTRAATSGGIEGDI